MSRQRLLMATLALGALILILNAVQVMSGDHIHGLPAATAAGRP